MSTYREPIAPVVNWQSDRVAMSVGAYRLSVEPAPSNGWRWRVKRDGCSWDPGHVEAEGRCATEREARERAEAMAQMLNARWP